MRIAIIGAGSVGRALAARFEAAGHTVVFAARDAEQQARIGEQAELHPDAVASAEMVLLAVPYDAAPEAIEQAGGLSEKIVVDATNPLKFDSSGLSLTLGYETSGAETLSALAPQARWVKCFNQTAAENMADPARFPHRPVMFVSSDDDAARAAVRMLAQEIGFEAVEAGPLSTARLLEPLAMLFIDLGFKYGQGRDFAFALTRPAAD